MTAPFKSGVNAGTSFGGGGGGVPSLIALSEGASETTRQLALAYSKGIGGTRGGVIETTFAEETETLKPECVRAHIKPQGGGSGVIGFCAVDALRVEREGEFFDKLEQKQVCSLRTKTKTKVSLF